MSEDTCKTCKNQSIDSREEPCKNCDGIEFYEAIEVAKQTAEAMPTSRHSSICKDASIDVYDVRKAVEVANPAKPAQADSHYRTLAEKGQEPITRMESIVCRGIPAELHATAIRNLNLAMASKYEDRAGCKAGEDWAKEIAKAKNYLHRALNGAWE